MHSQAIELRFYADSEKGRECMKKSMRYTQIVTEGADDLL